MSENTDRLRLEKVDKFAVSSLFVIMEGAGYERKKYVPVSDISHLERYQYAFGSEKITLVYDTVAKILTIDAKTSILDALKVIVPKPAPPVDYSPREIVVMTKKPAPKPAPKPVPKPVHKQPKPEPKPAPPPVTEKPAPPQKEVKNESFSLSKFSKNRLDWCLQAIKEMPDVKLKHNVKENESSDAVCQITHADSKITLVFAKNQTVTIQGKSGKLFDDIKTVVTTQSDLRQLKKFLPVGIRYLSEPSRIDLSNGITDLAGNVRLSDYSVLLIAPYRALEKLIYDLQQAENINVKMIGQAYEKDDAGNYMLKKGYAKRIPSVIYCEVMSAMYTEYFAIRNFYTHSDNSSESKARGISNKTDAQNILNKLLKVVEYNCKKLAEIGFNMENN